MVQNGKFIPLGHPHSYHDDTYDGLKCSRGQHGHFSIPCAQFGSLQRVPALHMQA